MLKAVAQIDIKFGSLVVYLYLVIDLDSTKQLFNSLQLFLKL